MFKKSTVIIAAAMMTVDFLNIALDAGIDLKSKGN